MLFSTHTWTLLPFLTLTQHRLAQSQHQENVSAMRLTPISVAYAAVHRIFVGVSRQQVALGRAVTISKTM